MFKNQLQELAQRSCFNLPAYACMREGPGHAPRFRASVNFNGEVFQSPGFSPTLRQAEHAAAEVALNVLSSRGSKSLTARVLDETGVYKNLLQETAHKAGLNLPVYTTVRSGPGHVPVFTCTVELAAMTFTGESAKTKKQAEKNAAIAAWSSLKMMPSLVSKKEASENNHHQQNEEEEQVIVTRVLSNFRPQKSAKQRDHHHYQSRHHNHYHHNYPHNHPRRSRNARPWGSSDYNSINYTNNYNKTWETPTEFPLITLPNSSTNTPDNPQKQQKNSSFVDLLPPPPPRTTSKILPLTSKTNINIIHKDQGQNGHFGDPMTNKHSDPSALQELGHTQFRNLFLGPLRCGQRANVVNYSDNLNGIAPAVQIRSIVPVCASPPPPAKSSSSSLIKPLPLNPTLLPSNSPTNLISDHNNLWSTQLNSDLSKLDLKN